MQHDSNLENYIQEIKNYSIYSKEEQLEYFKRYNNGEKYLIDDIFKMNALLVIKSAKKFLSYTKTTNLDFMDLVQYGNLGLLDAIKTYDLSYNASFSTWACPLIERKIANAIWTYGYPVKFLEKSWNKMKIYNEHYDRLFNELNREPTIHELSVSMNISENKVIEIQNFKLRQNATSLNNSISEEGSELIEFVVDENFNDYDNLIEQLSQSETRKYLLEILKEINLTNREYQIILMRYGFIDGKIKTQVEIAKHFNICRQFVFYMQHNAIKKIVNSKYIFELALHTNNPIGNLEKLGYDREEIQKKFEKIKKI